MSEAYWCKVETLRGALRVPQVAERGESVDEYLVEPRFDVVKVTRSVA